MCLPRKKCFPEKMCLRRKMCEKNSTRSRTKTYFEFQFCIYNFEFILVICICLQRQSVSPVNSVCPEKCDFHVKNYSTVKNFFEQKCVTTRGRERPFEFSF